MKEVIKKELIEAQSVLEKFITDDNIKKIESAVRKVIASKDIVNINIPIVATVPEKCGTEPVAEFNITLSMKEY